MTKRKGVKGKKHTRQYIRVIGLRWVNFIIGAALKTMPLLTYLSYYSAIGYV